MTDVEIYLAGIATGVVAVLIYLCADRYVFGGKDRTRARRVSQAAFRDMERWDNRREIEESEDRVR